MGKIVVVGSYVVDLMSRTPKMPRPGETVLGGPFKMGPGGKGGNQAVAAARQGAEVTFVTKVGKDSFGEQAIQNFKDNHIATDYVFIDEQESTGAALIAVDDSSQNMIVVALGACGKLTSGEVYAAEESIKQCSHVLLQLETSMEAVETTIQLACKHGKDIILNPAPYQKISDELLSAVTYITPNETEATELTGIEVSDVATAEQAAKVLHEKGIQHVIITLGEKGSYLFTNQKGKLVPPYSVKAIDTTGAGDAFNGGFAYALSEGRAIREAVIYANAVAALSVTSIGTAPAMPYREETERLVGII